MLKIFPFDKDPLFMDTSAADAKAAEEGEKKPAAKKTTKKAAEEGEKKPAAKKTAKKPAKTEE